MKIKTTIILLFILCNSKIYLYSQNIDNQLVMYCVQFNQLNTNILHNTISTPKVKTSYSQLIQKIKQVYLQLDTNKSTSNQLVFPLLGYTKKAIGGTNGNGYLPNGYLYFDGNKHKAHPAHDIFIYDKNQDNLDDRTKAPVQILAVTDGVVIALANNWNDTSNLRGGNYLYLYNPALGTIFYYAHCNEITVKIGTKVKAGQVIGTVGRTGMNAFKKRSPTHLHLMQLILNQQNLPIPANYFNKLN